MTKPLILSLFLFLIGAVIIASLKALNPEAITRVERVEIIQTVKIGEPDQQLTIINGKIITNQDKVVPFRSFPGKVNIYEIVLSNEQNPLVEKDADFVAFLRRHPEIAYDRNKRTAIFRLKENGKTMGTFIDLNGHSEEEFRQWEDYALD